jgi:hypothetical protein
MEVQTYLRSRITSFQKELEMMQFEDKMGKAIEATIILFLSLVGFIIDVLIVYFGWQLLPFGGVLTLKAAFALVLVVRALFPSIRTMQDSMKLLNH